MRNLGRPGRFFVRFCATLVATMRWQVVVALVLLVAAGAVEGLGLLLLIPLLQAIGLDAGDGQASHISHGVTVALARVGLRANLGLVLTLFVCLSGVRIAFSRWEAVSASALQYGFVSRLRDSLFRAVAGADWLFLSRCRASDLTYVMTSEIDRIGAGSYSVVALAETSLRAVIYAAFAFRLSPQVTIVVMLCGAAMAAALSGVHRRSLALGEKATDSGTLFYAGAIDSIAGLKTAKSYGVEARAQRQFSALSRSVSDVGKAALDTYAYARAWFEGGSVLMLAVLVFVSAGVLSLPGATVLMLLYLFARLTPILTAVQRCAQESLTMAPAFDNVMRLEARCLQSPDVDAGVDGFIGLKCSLRFEGVAFRYAPDERLVLRTVDLEIRAGSVTAIVGASGAGKSTIADLMMGLLAPTDGRIVVDGCLLDASNVRGWRQHVSYVAQDSFFFHASIRENLTWVCPAASESEIARALTLSAADQFVRELPHGLDTIVGDRASRISGGERQRLALARALLRRPALLILDEATSALDSENESRVHDAIERLRGAMTIVVIAHRPSSLRRADTIHVLDGGRVAQSGSWDTLVAPLEHVVTSLR
jgi:ATP-binding cassette subfamily C protein